ncbi:NAD-dependent epimerase/dehydratase family protein [Rhodococcoides kyotonense]|uniref:Saccharopine dehydrogenase, NADP-dependent n=1 Tax=Rhodococcoides kyotonense TaxID=398843 RepID=A0A239MT88_9NOCA|nr:NAD-dependent epimerase/dehydratase family protein [Rhodococcus kyotonensis]SNT45951.1 Saccharopine dehydrogenase, NADP-dependent [Rhodococcus kyotonensis]
MTVLVLGGYGAVGRHIVGRLRDQGIDAAAAGRDARRADVTLDLAEPASFAAALGGVDVVVNASGSEDIRLAETAAATGVPFIDISATSEYTEKLEHVRGPVLIGVGIAPGLSGMLARDVFTTSSSSVDVAIGLGAGEKHGAAATEWTYGLMGKKFVDPDGAAVANFTGGKVIDFPVESGYRRFPSYRADFADQHRLTDELGVPVRTYLRLDSRLMTMGLATLTHVPWLARLSPSSMPGGDRWAIVARDQDGRSSWATGREQSVATAVVAAWAAQQVASGEIDLGGPAWLHGAASLSDIAPTLSAAAFESGAAHITAE